MSIFYQMENNDKQSCGEKTRYISTRYFFIKEMFSRENIEVIHYPLEMVIVDSFTKLRSA